MLTLESLPSVHGWGPHRPHPWNHPQCACNMLTSIQWIIPSLLVAPCPLFPCYWPTPLMRFPPHSQVTGLTSMSKDPWTVSIHELRVTYVSPYASPSVSLCMFLRVYLPRPPCVCPLRVHVRECSFCVCPTVCMCPSVCMSPTCVGSFV